MPETTGTGTAQKFELNITRTIRAPRELVWRALREPEMAKQWMGPETFRTTHFEAAGEVGGTWRLCMEGKRPDGMEVVLWQSGKVLEIDPPERLVYSFAWEDRSKVGLGSSPFAENVVTIELKQDGADTILHFHQAPFATEGERDGHNMGWSSSFERLARFAQSQAEGEAR